MKKTQRIRYYSHALSSAILAQECGDDVERADIIVVYEFQS